MKSKRKAQQFTLSEPAILIGALAVIVGIGIAAWGAWTCDDAYISYRYAKNLVDGHGFVYNLGERVEGYTNLLWTLWIAVGLVLKVQPDTWSTIWSLLAYGSVILLLLSIHLELRQRLAVTRYTLPVACLVAALHPEFQIFATSGLETAAFTATAFAGYVVLARGLISDEPKPVLFGVLFGLASMLRPDGIVFAAVAGVALVLTKPLRPRVITLYALTVSAFWGGTTAFRILYYGDYFPNTYYAKSAYLAWHAQGVAYLRTYLVKYWVLFVAPFALVIAYLRNRKAAALEAEPDFLKVHARLSFAFAAVYAYYVVRVGGDFMFARLLIPVTPYLAILLELALYRLSITRCLAYLELVFAALALPLVTPRPVSATEWVDGVADEHDVYSDERVSNGIARADVLGKFFEGLPVRVAFLGTEARIMYEANIPVAIESEAGLTDRIIARQALTKRGRIGHEKRADPYYLIEQRKAQFMLTPVGPGLTGVDKVVTPIAIHLGPVDAWILYWDPPVMEELARRGAKFTDIGVTLDRYIKNMSSKSDAEVRSDYEKFRRFYFGHVNDAGREAAFRQRLGG
jgi:hypothetical protein